MSYQRLQGAFADLFGLQISPGGLDHFEGRSWPGLHRHALMMMLVYESHDQLRTHFADFMAAYNFARRLKALSDPTPYEYIAKIWTSEPDRFIVYLIHQIQELNTQRAHSCILSNRYE